MRVGVPGSGLMGGKLGTPFARAGHEVIFSYARGEQKLKRLAREAQGNARAGTPREAAREADALLLDVQRSRIDDVLKQAGDLSDKMTGPPDGPLQRAVCIARRPSRLRKERGAGTGVPVRVARQVGVPSGRSLARWMAEIEGTEMTLPAATVVSFLLLAPLCVQANQGGAATGSNAPPSIVSSADSQRVGITRAGSQPSRSGPAENFTGSVRVDPLFQPDEPSRVSAAIVTFEPGARTAWHTHPLGQHLVVTAGCGWVQQWGGAVQVIRPGDVVRIPPGQKHWHGATTTTGMSHIAIQEQRDGKTVEWMEKVSDEQYRSGSSAE